MRRLIVVGALSLLLAGCLWGCLGIANRPERSSASAGSDATNQANTKGANVSTGGGPAFVLGTESLLGSGALVLAAIGWAGWRRAGGRALAIDRLMKVIASSAEAETIRRHVKFAGLSDHGGRDRAEREIYRRYCRNRGRFSP